jgi:hypothetical protein
MQNATIVAINFCKTANLQLFAIIFAKNQNENASCFRWRQPSL